MENLCLHTLKPPAGSSHRKRRLGRGIGSGRGKTSGRGHKGQKSKGKVHPSFEGGQTPLHRRLPVIRGFKNINHKEFSIINLDDLESLFNDDDHVTPELLIEKGVIHNIKDGVKVLGFGEIKKKLKVNAHAFSKSAEEKIVAARGEAIKL